MVFAKIFIFLFLLIVLISKPLPAVQGQQALRSAEPTIGSWMFSGVVDNESGDKYGYFFAIQRQGSDFYSKAALIDEKRDQLVFFYEDKEKVEQSTELDWHIGRSFMHYNPINDSWIFGVKVTDKKGFNFKADMLKQANKNETLVLRPGINIQVLETSQLNGHLFIDEKEQFVTANKAWFGKLLLSSKQKSTHNINTVFCRLNDNNGFYSANLKELDATGAAVAGWFDPLGNKLKMSQFIAIKYLDADYYLLSIALPKLRLKVRNSLQADKWPHSVAGFSKGRQGGFCFLTQQSFLKAQQEGQTGSSNQRPGDE